VGIADAAAVRAELQAVLASADRRKKLYDYAMRFGRTKERADELVNTACVKALGGDRKWNREEYPDLVDFLGSAMFSTRGHDLERADNRRQQLHDGPDDEDRVRDASGDEKEADERTERKLVRWLGALRKDRANDKECLRLLESFEKGCLKAAKQAEETGWKVPVVRRVRRRLFDRAEVVMRTTPDDSGAYDTQEAT
jgi:hypothetical protein